MGHGCHDFNQFRHPRDLEGPLARPGAATDPRCARGTLRRGTAGSRHHPDCRGHDGAPPPPPLPPDQQAEVDFQEASAQYDAAVADLAELQLPIGWEAPSTAVEGDTSIRLVTDTAFKVANDALQLLGGYGYLADYGIEKIVRDLRVHQILEGTNEIMRVITARALIGAPA